MSKKSDLKTKSRNNKTKSQTETTEELNLNNLISDFKSFISQYSIISLALGIVIGNLTQGTVKALVEGLITPLLNIIIKVLFNNFGELNTWEIILMDDIIFKPGLIIRAILEFIIILFTIYVVFKKILNKPDLIPKK